MTADLIAFPGPRSNGLTRGQAKFLRGRAARCRKTAELASKGLINTAEGFEAVLRKRYLTPDDWEWLELHMGTINYAAFAQR